MEKKVELMVEEIKNIVNNSSFYSFKDNPFPIYCFLLNKFEEKNNFSYNELPYSIKNKWREIYSNNIDSEDQEVVKSLQEVKDSINNVIDKYNNIDDAIDTILLVLLYDDCKGKRLKYFEMFINTYVIYKYWSIINSSVEYSFEKNPYPVFKFLLEKYMECIGIDICVLPNYVKNIWEKILINSLKTQTDVLDQLAAKMESDKSERPDSVCETIINLLLFLASRVEYYCRKRDYNSKPNFFAEDFFAIIYALRKCNTTKKLWDIVDNNYFYSFKKEPLPVFQVLVKYYLSHHMPELELPKDWRKILNELEHDSHNAIDVSYKEMFDKFDDILLTEVGEDEYLLSLITDFFVEKYAELHKEEGGEYIMPKELVNFIYWYAVGTEACTNELAIYNPYATLCSFGSEHAEQLNTQLRTYDTPDGVLEYYQENPAYCGVEANRINRLIGSVRLLIKNPMNLARMCIYADDPFNSKIEGFSGGWTYIAVPPIATKDINVDSFVEITTKLIDKFLKTPKDCMSDAFFVLPKAFCYEGRYYGLRRRIVDMGVLGSVIELPRQIFRIPFEAVIVYLNKECYYPRIPKENGMVSFINAKQSVEGLDNDLFTTVLDDGNDLIDLTIHNCNDQSKFHIRIEEKIIAQHNYCLLPDLYIIMPPEKKEGEIHIQLGELLSIVKGDNNDKSEGTFISLNSFRDSPYLLFEAPSYEQQVVENGMHILTGEYLVLTYIRDKFLICKTLESDTFCLKENQVAFKTKRGVPLSLDYISLQILRSGNLKRLALSMTDRGFGHNYNEVIGNILNSAIVIQLDKTIQNEEIDVLRLEYEQMKVAEAEAEKKRNAHRDVSSDISHMLGSTFDRIGDSLTELKDIEGATEISSLLKDSFEYMKRLIDSVGKDFSKSPAKPVEKCVNDFINQYCIGWKNYGKNTFDLQYETVLSNETTFMIDEILIKVLLDTILDNAYRHGFDRFRSSKHIVNISTSYVSMDGKYYVLLKVANNGKVFPDGFTTEKYISRGQFSGDTGRTGLGGNHVYNIARHHDGYINLTHNSIWNAIIEILLPVEYFDEVELNKIEVYENAKECM